MAPGEFRRRTLWLRSRRTNGQPGLSTAREADTDHMLKTAAGFAALLAIVQTTDVQYIGTATMAADGTITLTLLRTSDGQHVHGVIVYKVGDPNYDELVRRLGGIKPGETKLVPPWP